MNIKILKRSTSQGIGVSWLVAYRAQSGTIEKEQAAAAFLHRRDVTSS